MPCCSSLFPGLPALLTVITERYHCDRFQICREGQGNEIPVRISCSSICANADASRGRTVAVANIAAEAKAPPTKLGRIVCSEMKSRHKRHPHPLSIGSRIIDAAVADAVGKRVLHDRTVRNRRVRRAATTNGNHGATPLPRPGRPAPRQRLSLHISCFCEGCRPACPFLMMMRSFTARLGIIGGIRVRDVALQGAAAFTRIRWVLANRRIRPTHFRVPLCRTRRRAAADGARSRSFSWRKMRGTRPNADVCGTQ